MAYKLIGAVLLLGTVALANGLVPLRIQVLVPKENPSFSAESTLPAMDLAVDDINDNSDLLNDYNFTLVVTDTRVSSFSFIYAAIINPVVRPTRRYMAVDQYTDEI